MFDVTTGERLFRSADDWWQDFDEKKKLLQQIRDYTGTPVPLYGLHSGDALQTRTSDGWQLTLGDPERDEPPFEKYLVQKLYLLSPDGLKKTAIAKDGACEIRAYGFSEWNNSFVWATSCEIVIGQRTGF